MVKCLFPQDRGINFQMGTGKINKKGHKQRRFSTFHVTAPRWLGVEEECVTVEDPKRCFSNFLQNSLYEKSRFQSGKVTYYKIENGTFYRNLKRKACAPAPPSGSGGLALSLIETYEKCYVLLWYVDVHPRYISRKNIYL